MEVVAPPGIEIEVDGVRGWGNRTEWGGGGLIPPPGVEIEVNRDRGIAPPGIEVNGVRKWKSK
jgi:hypothetical protein